MKTITENIKPLLGLAIILLSFTYFFVNLFGHTDPNDQILIAIVGMSGNVIGYYYGSNTGQSKKDEAIQKLAENTKDK